MTNRREGYVAEYRGMTIWVTAGQDGWMVDCAEVGLQNEKLASSTKEEAQTEARMLCEAKCGLVPPEFNKIFMDNIEDLFA